MPINTNDIMWQDAFDRERGQGKYTPTNYGGLAEGSVGNPLQLLQQPSRRMPIMRGQPVQWSPGEFAELSLARSGGMPTMYGRIMQDRYNRRKFPTAPGQVEREEAALTAQYPDSYNPLDMLRKGRY